MARFSALNAKSSPIMLDLLANNIQTIFKRLDANIVKMSLKTSKEMKRMLFAKSLTVSNKQTCFAQKAMLAVMVAKGLKVKCNVFLA